MVSRPDYEALPTPATPVSGETLMSLLDRIEQVPNDEASSQHKARLQQKVANAAQTYLAKIALLYNRNQFLAKINDEGKARRAADQKVIGTARVVTYEDLEDERAKRAVMDAKAAEKMATKAAKNIANATRDAEGATIGKTTRGRKRKNTASAAAPRAKTAQISDTLVAEGEDEAGASEPQAKAARTRKRLETPSSIVAYAEDEIALEGWRAPVAQMW
ncbi:hypothetical protein IAQ61_009570 [Plenodomus lingam]|uniref:Uncharacterized protein n=1 Tax=Leptosphaeria maculans (strain JN3 / isolate v23.1.3 / race Av1-4-5-6-7-8) TaxID=985895 RepID=E4ZT05_LEPMJ|nr:hypothetical protein LEMA_P120840.1 [Plenodomus lingam JN3]KAH9863293.1 hypothetical protein IAQ61_009570 [Plenodomus lingam]CBX94593.1 hypothetical protein LEMA_P120840.1 [Plenodomus lingam JN3]